MLGFLLGLCFISAVLISIVLIMDYIDEEVDWSSSIYDGIDSFLKFCVAPQIMIYHLIKDKLRLSGIIIFEAFISIFFAFTNVVLFSFFSIVFLFKLLWRLFVKVFGKKGETDDD